MTVSTIVWSPTVQWGGSAGAAWADAVIVLGPPIPGVSPQINPVTGGFAGVIFDATLDQTLRFATVGGVQRPLDPPILLTFQFEATFGQAVINAGTDNRLEIGIVPDGSPDNFSNALRPWTRGEQSLGIFTLGTLPAFGAAPVVLQLTVTTTNATVLRALSTSRSDWNGRVALSFRAVGANAFDLFNFTPNGLVSANTTQESVFFSGLAGGPYGGHVRSVRDGRYAMPATNLELVRDGDQPGLFVRAWDQDPEDEQATYRRRPGEGTVDDQVPDL